MSYDEFISYTFGILDYLGLTAILTYFILASFAVSGFFALLRILGGRMAGASY